MRVCAEVTAISPPNRPFLDLLPHERVIAALAARPAPKVERLPADRVSAVIDAWTRFAKADDPDERTAALAAARRAFRALSSGEYAAGVVEEEIEVSQAERPGARGGTIVAGEQA